MTRATEAFTTLGIAAIIYTVLFFGLIPFPDVIQNKIIPVVSASVYKWSVQAASEMLIATTTSFRGGAL